MGRNKNIGILGRAATNFLFWIIHSPPLLLHLPHHPDFFPPTWQSCGYFEHGQPLLWPGKTSSTNMIKTTTWWTIIQLCVASLHVRGGWWTRTNLITLLHMTSGVWIMLEMMCLHHKWYFKWGFKGDAFMMERVCVAKFTKMRTMDSDSQCAVISCRLCEHMLSLLQLYMS